MTLRFRERAPALALASIAAFVGCGGPGPKTPEPTSDADLPPLSAIVREGDPAPVLGLFVATEGIEPAAGGAAAVALAAILESRLAKLDARITPQQDGVRADIVFENAGTVEALRHALLDPVGASDPAHAIVRRKLEALARIPPAETSCGSQLSPGERKLESVDGVRASIGLGRVALAVVGGPKAADAARAGLRAGKRWPKASAFPGRSPWPKLIEGKPRVIARAGAAASAAAARALGARFSTEMVLHGGDACIGIDTGADPASIASGKRAIVDALAASKDASLDAESARAIREAGDARDAAQRAAVWGLARLVSTSRTPEVSVVGPAGLESALARAEADLASTVLEARTRTEPGQGSVWVLLASPCGTQSEAVNDAGVSALFVTAASKSNDDVALEPWIAPDGIGILGHAVRPVSDARVGELVARAVFDSEMEAALPAARSALLGAVQPALATLGIAIAPGHPSWVVPTGTPDALLRIADTAVTTRAASLRAGPWRAAILSDDASMPAPAVIDRRIPRTQTSRTCPTVAPRASATPGIYAAGAASGAAYLAFPLEDAAIAVAPWLVAALDGELLHRTLVETGMVRSASARIVGAPRAPSIAVFLEAPGAALDAAVQQTRTLLARIRTSGFTPDESTRARTARAKTELHERFDPRRRVVELWRGTKTEAAPNDDALRTAAAAVFHDESLVVVAARPPKQGGDK